MYKWLSYQIECLRIKPADSFHIRAFDFDHHARDPLAMGHLEESHLPLDI
jgi:hypothetical protein